MAKKKQSAGKRLSPAKIVADSSRYLMNTYKRPPVVFTHGRGVRLYDSQGREYLDFLAGIAVNALGYSHPRIVRVIRREAGRATHISNLFHNPYQAPLAKKLAEWSGLDRVFFSNSGSEAVEGALKLARAYAHAKTAVSGAPAKTQILAMENSFHGRTFGALSITHTPKYRMPFEPLVPGVEFVRVNDVVDLEAEIRRNGLRRGHRADARRGWYFPDQRRILAEGALAGHAKRRRIDRGRDSNRPGTHRPLFCLSEIRRGCASGHRHDR